MDDSWCTDFGGIRQSDGLRVTMTFCAEQYTGADGSLDMRVFLAGDGRLVPRAVNTFLASLPP